MKICILAVCCLLAVVQAQDVGYFWHVTDFHYDTTYWSEMRSCNDEVPVRGIYGDYWCDSPWRLVNDSIVAMADIKKNVDFILWTGDNVAHIKDQYINETYNIYILKSITDALKTQFPDVKVYATMGNHDWWPSDQFPDTTHRLYNETAELWSDWIEDPRQVANFRKGAYYTVKTSNGLRIVGLNTNLYYTSNKLTVDIPDPADQFHWLADVLKNASSAGEKVLLTAHIPPGILGFSSAQWFYDNFNINFNDILKANADVIMGSFFGHEHSDVIRHLRKADGSPGVAMFMAPSVTPWRYKIPTATGSPHNPAIRLVKYNRVSNLLLDIEQYYMDLTGSNKNNASNWKLAYRASQTYGEDDLSADSVDNLVKKMRTDTALLDQYIRLNTVLANGNTTVKECDDSCRANIICSLDNLEKGSMNDCVASLISASERKSWSYLLLTVAAITYFLLL